MFRHIPNLLTGSRLLLAGIFFTLLSWYQYQGRGDPSLIVAAFFIYSVALFTDFLDGFLARRWKVEGAFGRIVDPFVDKVLVIGSFIFFAGKNFIIHEQEALSGHHHFVAHTISGVVPAMVVLILARELLVTSLRAASESSGHDFGAAFSGKLKMVLQSFTILAILVYIVFYKQLDDRGWRSFAENVRDTLIWLTVAVTAVSGLMYVRRAMALYRGPGKDGDAAERPSPPARERAT